VYRPLGNTNSLAYPPYAIGLGSSRGGLSPTHSKLDQAVNLRGYTGVAAGATEPDIEAVATWRLSAYQNILGRILEGSGSGTR